MTRRRDVITLLPLAGAAVLQPRLAHAQAGPLDPKDPQAVSLGYVPDTTKADQAKYPKHTADQKCATCQLYTGANGSATGPCPIFGNKLVSSKGWCSAWTKKA